MAAQSRRGDPHLETVLNEEGWRFDFFQAVRLLQLMAPDSTPLGTGDNPATESVRLSSHITMGFPPSEVHEIRAHEAQAEMAVNFMGIASPSSYGSLPMPYTEMILDRAKEKNETLRHFLDLFNHRLVSLFYRAWEKHRFAVVYELSGQRERGHFEQVLFSLMGLGTYELQRNQKINSRALLARAHAVRPRGVSAQGLATIIQDYFHVTARIVQFIPAWYDIEPSELSRLNQQSCTLGEDLCLGARTRMAQSRYRVCLGPLSWQQMADFLPNGSAYGSLSEICTLTTGPEFDFEFQLQLAPDQTPPLRVGAAKEQGKPRLGWSTWLLRSQADESISEVIIDGELKTAALNLSA